MTIDALAGTPAPSLLGCSGQSRGGYAGAAGVQGRHTHAQYGISVHLVYKRIRDCIGLRPRGCERVECLS